MVTLTKISQKALPLFLIIALVCQIVLFSNIAVEGTSMKSKIEFDPSKLLALRSDPDAPANSGGLPVGLAKPVFLIVSAPALGKVCWTEVNDINKAKNDKVYPLVDGNLLSPRGLAYNKYRGKLYVGDLDGKKIVQYTLALVTDEAKGTRELEVDGPPLTIAMNIDVRWVAVDAGDNLYYTDQKSNTVNKITADTIQLLESKQITPDQLLTVTASEIAAEKKARQLALSAPNAVVQPPPLQMPQIQELYNGGNTDHVSAPAGVATNGEKVFWGNAFNGKKIGSICEGTIDPANAGQPDIVDTHVNVVNGLALTSNKVIYTDVANNVYAATTNIATSQKPVHLTAELESPKGAIWDGDGTLYVADSTKHQIFALAVGGDGPQSPEPVVSMQGAFGLTLVRPEDPGLLKKTRKSVDSHAKLTLYDHFLGSATHTGSQALGLSAVTAMLVGFLGLLG